MRVFQIKFGSKISHYTKNRDYLELIKGSSMTFILRLLSFILLYVLNFMIAKVYGAEALGIYTLSFTLLTICLTLVLLGTDTAIIRLITEYRSQYSMKQANIVFTKVMKLLIPLSVLFSVLLFILAEPIAILLFQEQLLIQPFRVVSIVLPFMVMTRMYSKAFRAIKSITKSIYFEIIGIRFGNLLILVFFLLLLTKDFMHIIYALSIAITITAFMSMYSWHKYIQKDEENQKLLFNQIETKGLKEILQISIPMYLTSAMSLILNWTDVVMLGIFQSTSAVGVYSIVLKLSLLISFSLSSINMIILPKFSELYWEGRKDDLIKIFHFSSRLIVWTSIPLLFIIILFAPVLLAIFGEVYIEGVIPLIILCIGQCINACAGSVMQLLNMTGNEKLARNAIVISAATNVLGNLILIPIFGMIGAAVATSLSIIIRETMASIYAYKKFSFRTWYIPFVK
ncbi:flippase [Cytobacillus sp. IB215665]|uniref:flippase n=1 Tax=Cytobacillus sp. IB215665 TaxID=3097357 RepID=UPI002A174745|nr:flippase [Cytobacillus sp. IB215665]MDX8363749.1 flippase [Cytobacillus sp. IB215665]